MVVFCEHNHCGDCEDEKAGDAQKRIPLFLSSSNVEKDEGVRRGNNGDGGTRTNLAKSNMERLQSTTLRLCKARLCKVRLCEVRLRGTKSIFAKYNLEERDHYKRIR